MSSELAEFGQTMSCVFSVLLKAIVDINLRLYEDYVSPLFATLRVPFPESTDGSDTYRRFQTFMGIMREFGDYLRPINKQLLPTNPFNLKDKQRLEGKVAVVTGADEGIGRDTAIELGKLGFKVIMGVQDVESMERILRIIKQSNESAVANIQPVAIDMTSLASVRAFADAVTKLEPKIDLLVNSGDEYSDRKYVTKEGFERNFVENYLSHFLITRLLLNNLAKSTNPRVINVASVAHHFGSINLADVNYEKSFYLPITAYNQSKLAQVLFTREMGKRLREYDIHVYAVNPGVLRKRHRLATSNYMFSDVLHKMSANNIGVQGVLYVALEDKFKNETGHYYRNHERVEFLTEKASDDVMARKLWELSCDYLKLETDVRLEPKSVTSSDGQSSSTAVANDSSDLPKDTENITTNDNKMSETTSSGDAVKSDQASVTDL